MIPQALIRELDTWRATQAIANVGLDGDPAKTLFRYARVRASTLYFIFSHPGGKYEFGLRKEQILEKMKPYWKLHKQRLTGSGVYFTKIEALCIAPPRSAEIVTVIKKEREVADGDFENRAKNPALFAVFEEIRKTIKESKKND